MSAHEKRSPVHLLHRLGKGVAAFFTHDVKIKREPEGVRLVLTQQATKTGPAQVREQQSKRRVKEDLELISRQLAELLDEQPETRTTLRHLVFVERAIAKHGLRALRKLPLDVLQRALTQLEGLVTNWSPAGLASLRSKMAVAIIDREHQKADDEDDIYRTSAVLDALPTPTVEEVHDSSDDEALAAAYAALGNLAPAAVEMQGELGSPAARSMGREARRPLAQAGSPPEAIRLRELQH